MVDERNPQLGKGSGSVGTEGRALRDISDDLLRDMKALRDLERESRVHRIGTPQHQQISAEIAELARSVFRLAAEQQRVAESVPAADMTVDELGSTEEDDRRSPLA